MKHYSDTDERKSFQYLDLERQIFQLKQENKEITGLKEELKMMKKSLPLCPLCHNTVFKINNKWYCSNPIPVNSHIFENKPIYKKQKRD